MFAKCILPVTLALFSPISGAVCWKLPSGEIVSTMSGSTPPERGAREVRCPREKVPSPPPPTVTSKSDPRDTNVSTQQKYQRENIQRGGMCSVNPAVYRCTREIGASTATSTNQRRSGPEVRGNPMYHEYLCVRTGQGYVCGGQSGGSLYGAGKADSVSVYNSRLCKAISGSSCVANCVSKAVANQTRPSYGIVGPGTNCQEWADQAAQGCLASCR